MPSSTASVRPRADNPFNKGDRVEFMPGPRAKGAVTGTVNEIDDKTLNKTGASGVFLVVICDDGKTRKVRPGSATPTHS